MNTQKNWHLKLNWRRGTYALTFPIYWRINGKIGLQVPDHVEDITLRLWVLLLMLGLVMAWAVVSSARTDEVLK